MTEPDDENLWATAQTWQALAVAAAIITPIACLFFLPWILQAADDDVMLRRVQMAGAAAAIGATLVTFCTVVWRGLISTQQARLQRLQIDKLSDQIAATERTNLASLLQKGAELIAEHEKPAQVAAGIASLRAVGEGSDEKFAIQAMDILADFVQQKHLSAFTDTLANAARDALDFINQSTRRLSNRSLSFHFEMEYNEPNDDVEFKLIYGVQKVYYAGGYFLGLDLFPQRNTTYEMNQVRLVEGCLDMRCARMHKVAVRDAAIFGTDAARTDATFYRCDFSNAEITHAEFFSDIREEENWYAPGEPPVGDEPDIDWSKRLNLRRPYPRGDEEDFVDAFGPD